MREEEGLVGREEGGVRGGRVILIVIAIIIVIVIVTVIVSVLEKG